MELRDLIAAATAGLKVDGRTREGRALKAQAKRCVAFLNAHQPDEHRIDAAIAEYYALRALETDAILLTPRT